jgi:hypothetical protein
MPDIDFFSFFRFALATVVTIYATIVTLQWAWTWYCWLTGSDRYVSLLRRYIILQGLRLRIRAFGGDVLICGFLCVAFFILWHAQTVMDRINERVVSSHVQQPVRHR